MPKDPDTVELSNGFSFYAHCGIVGIDAKGKISTGYDQGEPMESYDEITDDFVPWPRETKIALADLMIARWTKFREEAK